MAAYADTEYYLYDFEGDVIPGESIEKWLKRASTELDYISFNRTKNTPPTDKESVNAIKSACCAIAEALYLVDVERVALTASKDENGDVTGAVHSMTSGKESITYANGSMTASYYGEAVKDMNMFRLLIQEVAVKYLANTTDSRGTNLLYGGI